MNIYSVWPFFGCMAILLFLASTPIMRAADTPPSPRPNRLAALDGLRGFLALGVFFHHAAITYVHLRSGRWEPPPTSFYRLLGQTGVAVFFMITGYLFWAKTVKEKGQPRWIRLYVGRVFRIVPLYLFAIASMLFIVFVKTRGHLQEPISRVGREIIPWLIPGLVLGPGHDINRLPDTFLILAGVTWTLRYEWLFYLTLPLTGLAARRNDVHLFSTISAFTATICYITLTITPEITAPVSVCIALFLAGMTIASLEQHNLLLKLPNQVSSSVVVSLLVILFVAFPSANLAFPTVLLGVAFALIVSGCNVFGLLTSQAARRLGDVSYGIYLLQGLVLTVVFSFRVARKQALASSFHYWAVILLCGMLLVAVATFTHVFVERTGIDLGKRLTAKR